MRNFFFLFVFIHLLSGNIFCQDNHFSLGGHLFAGEYPINNPVSTGDTGMVYLYQLSNKSIIPVDTLQFSSLGYFVFIDLHEGEYMLKAGLTKNSTHYSNFFPTYFASNLRWNSSASVTLNDSSVFEANIRLLPTANNLPGMASIRGYVVQSSDEDSYRKVQGTEVILFNEVMVPVTFCLSDDNGHFSFEDLPYGTYHLLVESTGIFSVMQKIILDKDHSDYDNLVLEIRSHQPAGIEATIETPGTNVGPLFPNPAEESVRTVIRSIEPEVFEVGIYAVTGIRIFSLTCQVAGIQSVEIPVSTLAKGTYLVMIRSSHRNFTKVQKLVKL